MKKKVALLLSFAMLFLLCACSQNSPEPAKTDPPKEGQEQSDTNQNNTTSDKQLVVGFNANNLTNETMTYMVEVFEQYGAEHNIKILTSEDKGDTATMLSNIENLVAAGADGIILMNNDPQGVEPILQDLVDKGIPFVSYDEYSALAVNSFYGSNEQMGTAIGEMAAEWINENLEGHVDVALIGVDQNQFLKNRGDALEKAIYDNVADVSVWRDNLGQDKPPQDVLANLVVGHPNIKVLVGVADACVVSAAEAWYGDLVGQGADLSQYGVFATDATNAALKLIKASVDGGSIMRGSLDLGLKYDVPMGMIQCVHAAIEGRDSGYPEVFVYKMNPVTEKNIDEFSQYISDAG